MVNEFNMRKKMIEGLMKEVQGPRFGSDEVISYSPWDEYLCGVVIPQSWKNSSDDSTSSPDFEKVMDLEGNNAEEDEGVDEINNSFSSTELDATSMIKSFGVSFSLEVPNPKFDICTTWARYFEEKDIFKAINLSGDEIELLPDDTVWKRYSFGQIFNIDFDDYHSDETIFEVVNKPDELMIFKVLNNFESEKKINNPSKDGFVKIYIKRLKMSDSLYTFSIYMVNDLAYIQKPMDFHADIDTCLFQPSIRINCSEEIKTQHIDFINESEEEFGFLYRDKQNVAVGHMCSAIWEKVDYVDKVNINQLWPDYNIRLNNNPNYEKFLKPDIRTDFVPLFPVALPKFDLEENAFLNSDDFNAEILANSSPDELYELLIKLVELYKIWIEGNENKLKDLPSCYTNIAENILSNENDALDRIKKGIELIKDEDLVYTSFCFANKAISLQNSWGQNKEAFKWRPFQIAFFLMCLEDIFDEDSENRDILDLLWIPTGGGKTEAYLGIMAFTIALRRLKAHENNETGAGTAIISRYTLRLLTVQQFRRTLKMVTAAELLRIDKSDNGIGWRPNHSKIDGDWIYGSTRFSAGLWVGGGVSPIHLLKSGGAIDVLEENNVQLGYSPGEPAQILKCPVCGSWLSVPNSGLNDEVNKLHIVVKSSLSEIDLESALYDLFEDNEIINLKNIESKYLHDGYYTLSFEICGKFTRNQFARDILTPITENECEIASLGRFNLGYFNSLNAIERISSDDEGVFDFEIWCTNPECDLNNIEWEEGCPCSDEDDIDFPDGNSKRNIYSPFEKNTRMPIPAYVIDDHVYTRCPTIIISTADKIARLAFEPRAGSIFGNVNYFNKYYGYNREGMFPQTVPASLKKFNIEIKPLNAPDLIIQDELHLIDGPLGSLFGLYEAIVSAIIEKQGGNPKYIASTATISNANKQVDLLFSKKLFQFPPHGLDISDNFFVKDVDVEEAWNEKTAGRIYLGVYAPGRGPMTPQVRLWGRMFDISNENKFVEKNIGKYWTVVGYYNTIKELGGALALYRDDIINRLENISGVESKDRLGEDNKEELSSRISSTDLPIILDDLERDGENDYPKYDAIFATSMFGTGVDVSHLSLMMMNSQPKTTGSYIQATGRIGRKTGGLIVDFFKAGRPRDLNHYEMFASYHSRINLGVEPVSVSPFSQGCISRGLGPALVAFLRNSANLAVNWSNNDGKKPIKNINSSKDFRDITCFIEDRLNEMENIERSLIDSILLYVDKCVKDWKDVVNSIEDKRSLRIFEYYFDKPKQHVVLGDSGHEYNENLKVVYNNAPQSLRDVEETIDFWV
ncbi:MAG: DISARM system helicase DrmA [Methanobrevibacter sp.]|uniref:DISARM system helicase DrmA n=1 Tax=Methanobrevibacter sp. TaxID=66852 RepID=UPI0025D19802|nr:DISARM system helicase DrmA [Methanobrevibacter sp.]MBR3112830.1 DISARM system helicase DrmA [Methanobrevibacter sp.]MBR4634417.1 DISARM system helicase DrmA [bacterium]